MGGFLKSFFASLLALVVFTVLVVLVGIGIVTVLGSLASSKKSVGEKAVLMIDLSQTFPEQVQENPLASLGSDDQYDVPGLYDVIRLLRHAQDDSAIKGIYIKCNANANGFASSDEIRNALLDFKKSGKFIYAYGEAIPQRAYYIANVADSIYCNPKGGVDWKGFATEAIYLKGTLDKLDIQPEVFYAGKFKSATEPLRSDKMSDADRTQTLELLNDLFNHLLYSTADSRHQDTAILRRCANEHLINYAQDALDYKLVDGLKYDDEVKQLIREKVKGKDQEFINFVPLGKYAQSVDFKARGKGKIALIYAGGEVVDGKGERNEIGSDTYMWLVRKARYDKDVSAIVIRVNSGGGSSLASENIWREISLARKEKPVILSFGDVAASGAYYLSCNADSIFAQPTTITGSIGVFSVLLNMKDFFKNKLGVTFDGVKTAPDADGMSLAQPLSPMQKVLLQNEVDSIYHDFKSRVADGRKLNIGFVDSIGQGRVWSGDKGLKLGLVDRLGGLQDAIDCAARMAKTSSYSLKEYPEPRSWLDILMGDYKKTIRVKAVQDELGADGYRTYSAIKKVRAMSGIPQARLPFDLSFE